MWKYTEQFKEEIELGLDVGIRSGRSADELSRDLRSYLQHPDKLFRRVRDEHGQLVLSQRAVAYHPGRGVYRSSYKNARRLAATETNMAYMTADYERWQQLDFVVGIRIELSNNHTLNGKKFRDICDELSAPLGSSNTEGKGCYPKDFKFSGWHPLCRCHVITILKTDEEIAEDTRRILAGEPLDGRSVNRVTDVPQEFTDWVRGNSERIEYAKSLPYFIKDNKDIVDGILNPKQKVLTTLEKAKLRHDARTPEQIEAIKNRWAERNASRSKLDDIITKVENFGVEYNPVKEYTKQPTIDEIILNLGGGDMTDGSCSSLALAYAGNRSGFFVLDFRDGRSQMYFSRVLNINEIAKKVGGMSCPEKS